MPLSSSDFVTDDSSENKPVSQEPETTTDVTAKDNIKGIRTAGWVLAFVLPFVGIFLNVWVLRNKDKYDINLASAFIPLLVSILFSLGLIVLLFQVMFVWAVIF